MDHETPELPDFHLGKEIAKQFAVSTAISAGTIAGFMVIGFVVLKYKEYKETKNSKTHLNPVEN